MKLEQDADLLKAIAQGDQKAFRQLFDRWYKPMCIYAMNYIDSFDDAEDITQNILAHFWIKYSKENFTGSLKGYLFRSVQYDCIRKLRREKRYISDEMLKLESLSEAELADGAMYEEMFPEEEYSDEAYIQLMHEVEQLPEQARRIFIAVVIEDRKYKEVASMLGISVNTVKTQLSSSLRRLRESLGVILFFLLHV